MSRNTSIALVLAVTVLLAPAAFAELRIAACEIGPEAEPNELRFGPHMDPEGLHFGPHMDPEGLHFGPHMDPEGLQFGR